MNYVLHFDIAALIFLAVYFLFLKIQYSISKRTNKLFQIFLISLFISTLLDIISSTMLNACMSRVALYIVCTLFYSFQLCPWWVFLGYICTLFDDGYRVTKTRNIGQSVGLTIFILYQVFVFTSLFTKFVFYIDDNGRMVHGKFYPTIGIIVVYYLAVGVIKVIRGRDKLSRTQFLSVLAFAILSEAAGFLQLLVFKQTLVFYFIAAIASFFVVFSLETPDYVLLTKTLEELKVAKKAAEEAEAAADEANSAKSEFLANMSHEVRTPLNGILGMTDIALDEDLSPNVREALTNIKASGQGLLAIINDILDISKIESGKMELVNTEFRLNDAIEMVENILMDKVRSKGLKYTLTYQEDLPNTFIGDEKRIRQIVTNLMTNAVKYTDSGSVSLNLTYVMTNTDALDLSISVKDTGIGIRDEDLPKLFSSFTRVELARNRSVEGTGLGLSIVKELLNLMNGTIDVKSVYQNGSEFIATIPLKIVGDSKFSKNEKVYVKETNEDIEDFSNLHILVVDDVLVNLKVICGLLRKTNAVLDSVLSGAECLELMKTQKYDLVLLDHMMPEMDGIMVLKTLQSYGDYINASTPIIMLTANAIEGQKEMYLSEGFTDYLSKPVNKDKLIEIIKKYC